MPRYSYKRFDSGADPDHDSDPELFSRIFATASCKNFAGLQLPWRRFAVSERL